MSITFNDYKQAVEYVQKLDDEGVLANIRRKNANEYIVETVGKSKDLTCPFCGETGFDRIGLKSHLEHGDCEQYNDTAGLDRI